MKDFKLNDLVTFLDPVVDGCGRVLEGKIIKIIKKWYHFAPRYIVCREPGKVYYTITKKQIL